MKYMLYKISMVGMMFYIGMMGFNFTKELFILATLGTVPIIAIILDFIFTGSTFLFAILFLYDRFVHLDYDCKYKKD